METAAAILTIVGALFSTAPQVEQLAAARQQHEIGAAMRREIALFRRFTLAHDGAARLQSQLAITRLSPSLRPRAQAMIPALTSARTEFELDLAAALIIRELEP